MSQSRCSLESCSLTTSPLHKNEGSDRSGMRFIGRRCSSSRLAVAAAAAVAISTTVSSGATSAAAFVVSPLHESASGRIPGGVGRRVGRLQRDGRGGDAVVVPPFAVEEGVPNYRVPTSLIMAVTDPETLLREDFASSSLKRGGPPTRGGQRAPSSSAAAAYASPSRVLQPGGSIYFVPQKISELDIDLEKTPRSSSSSSSRLAPRTIQKRGRSPVSLKRKKVAAQSKKKTASSLLASEASKTEGTVAIAAAPQVKQIIESELEVVEEANHVSIDEANGAKKTATRAFNPVSSTPAEQKRSVKARRKESRSTTTAMAVAKGNADGSDSSQPVGRPTMKTMAPTSRTTTSGGNSRSSTMPGFADRKNSGRHRAFRDGIKIAEERSGKNIKKILASDETLTKDRRKSNSEAMYKSSASVPDSLIAYTNEIHEKTERITPNEEIELGTKTQEAIRLQNLYEDLELELSREPTDAEWCAAAGKINMEALQNAIEDGMDAKNRLVEANLRMVQGVVNLYIRNGLGSQYNAGDLMQEGTMALIRAAEKFEPERGFRFSTYAMYWIRAAVKRSQILQSRVIQVPQRLHETHKRIQKVEKELKGELGRYPTKEELALASNLSVLQLERCVAAMAQECYSLDATIQNTRRTGSGTDRKATMYDIVNGKMEDEGYKKGQQQLTKDSLISTLRRVLTPHEVDLLLLRFGLMDERTLPHGFAGPLTIAEVSRLVGLKPDKVRRMINKCLSKLRPLIAHEWEDYEREL